MTYNVIYATVILMSITSTCYGCSMLTHGTVSRRAFQFFNFSEFPGFAEMVAKYPGSFEAGSTFPDWGYQFHDWHEAAEAAHWPPFQKTAADYLVRKYPQPWSEEGQKLAVFLMGAASHMVADILWHSIAGVSEGFIDAMSKSDYAGNYGNAHSDADIGGDAILTYQFDVTWFSEDWEFPVADIAEIYREFGWKNMTEADLLPGLTELYAGAMALRTGGELLYSRYAGRSTFLSSQYQSYFLGGLDDMSGWVGNCWVDHFQWFRNTSSTRMCQVLPRLPADLEAISQTQKHEKSLRDKLPDDLIPHLDHTRKYVVAQHSAGKSLLLSKRNQPNDFASSSLGADSQPIRKESLKAQSGSPQPVLLYSSNTISYLGRDVQSVDLNKDGLADLILSAPGYGSVGAVQYGCIYIVFGNKTQLDPIGVLDVDSGPFYKICGNETRARFGWQVQALDFNKDGVLDLAVSSPLHMADSLLYLGAVGVYFGQLNDNGAWRVRNPLAADVFIEGETVKSNLGSVLAVGDLNNDGTEDLIIGAPFASVFGKFQNGFVTAFFSSTSRVCGQILHVEDSDWLAYGQSRSEWFGSSIEVDPKSRSVIIGSPSFAFGNCTANWVPAVGKVSAYSLRTLEDWTAAPVWTIVGTTKDMRLGSAFSLSKSNDSLIALSLPTVSDKHEQQGNLVVLSVAKLAGAYNLSQIAPSTSFLGVQEFGLFGDTVRFANLNIGGGVVQDALFIGYPEYKRIFEESGCLLMFGGSIALPRGVVENPINSAKHVYTSIVADVHAPTPRSLGLPEPKMTKDTRFGSAFAFGDFNGDGKTDIAIGASRQSKFKYLGGTVEIIYS